VDVFYWESFGKGWRADIEKELRLEGTRFFEADYGQLPDLLQADPGSDMEQRLAATSLKPGDQVTLGIRPEDTEVVGPEAQADVQGQVHLIEPIGSDKYVSVHIGEAECMVRTSPRLVVEKGEAINLKLAWQRAHIFDQTGRNVFAVTP
jgi:ABC-type sugar transport system ATPase subunit